ncbi:MAG: hypothetical protein RL577_336 [Bacteroidota bacterium]|jgi:hypothetical protein
MRNLLLCLFLTLLALIPQGANSLLRADTSAVVSEDSISLVMRARLWNFKNQSFHPFMENSDSAFFWNFSPQGVGIPRQLAVRQLDPLSPFSKDLFVRQSSAKFWMFGLAVLWLLVLLYFRNAFPKQFEMRTKSLFSSYNFSELMNEKLGFASAGTLLSQVLGWSVMAMVVITIWVYSQLLNLNNPALYTLALLGIVVWELLVYLTALLFSEATGLYAVVRSSWQRKANASLWFGILVFPLVLLAYYNAPKLQAHSFELGFVYLVILFFGLRLIWVFTGILRERSLSLAAVLYFCAIECLPLALVLKGLASY